MNTRETHVLKLHHPASGQTHVLRGYSTTDILDRLDTHQRLGWVPASDISVWRRGRNELPFDAGLFQYAPRTDTFEPVNGPRK